MYLKPLIHGVIRNTVSGGNHLVQYGTITNSQPVARQVVWWCFNTVGSLARIVQT